MYPVVSGDLAERSLGDVLLACQRVGFYGTIRITTPQGEGYLGVRAGIVSEASWLGKTGDAALALLAQLVEGSFEIRQRLVAPDGAWCPDASYQASVDQRPLPEVLDHCARLRLTGRVTLEYRDQCVDVALERGEVADVRVNDQPSHSRILRLIQFTTGTMTIAAAPLDLGLSDLPARPPRLAAGTVAPAPSYATAAPDDPTAILLAIPAAEDAPSEDDDDLAYPPTDREPRPTFALSDAPLIAAPHGTSLTRAAPPSLLPSALAAIALIGLSIAIAILALQ